MGSNKHDQVLLEILKQERSIVSFLDSVFGFLYRCTDFYHHQLESSQKIGFPAGVANEVVQKMFQRYEKQTLYEEQAAKLTNIATKDNEIPTASEEVVVVSDQIVASYKNNPEPINKQRKQEQDVSEVYNGDDRGIYRWSQTIRDIDVFIPVPKQVLKAKQLKVKIDPYHLKVESFHLDESTLLVDKAFPYRVTVDECLWSLVAGSHIQINLEKKEEQWWDRLFTSDPPINTKEIDTTVTASDLSQEEHMKIEELVLNQEKRQQFSSNKIVGFQTKDVRS